MLSRRGRIAFALATVLLAGLYVLPVWTVRLTAPQYPEGIGMQIRLSTITGLKPNDLDNINNLNHYIGMKRIEPEAIPELRLMPLMVGALMAIGAAAAVTRRPAIAWTFVVAFAALGIAGLVDFWWWEYDYGHNLDLEQAIIVIPGMSYQPPLIGSKQLANFVATSLPAAGAIAALASFSLAASALLMDRRAVRASRAVRSARAVSATNGAGGTGSNTSAEAPA